MITARDMKINISDLAMNETVEFVKTLNTRKAFESIIKRFVELNKKEIQFYVSVNSNNLKDSMFHYIRKFDLNNELIEYVKGVDESHKLRAKFRNKEFQFEDAIRKINDEIKAINNSKSISMETESELSEKFISSYEFMKLKNTINFLFNNEIEKKELELNKLKISKKLIDNLRKNSRNLCSNISDLENIYFKLIKKFYINRVLFYTKKMFPNSKIKITTDKSADLKDEAILDSRNGISLFENGIIQWIEKTKLNLRIEISKDKQLFVLSNGSINNITNSWMNQSSNKNESEEIFKINKKFNNFYKNNESFFFAMRSANLVKQKNKQIYDQIISYLFKNNYEQVIEYNELAKEKNEILNSEKEEIKLKSLEEVFDDLIVISQIVEDRLTSIALGEKSYKNVIKAIEGENFILNLY